MVIKLSNSTLADLPKNVTRPGYGRADLSPGIVHIGVGNFHRAHQAVYLQRLFNMGLDHDWALVGAGIRASDKVMRDRLARQDWLSTVVDLDPKGLVARVVGSMIDFVEIDPEALIARIADPAIRIVSMTITEGGYFIDAATLGFDLGHPEILADIAAPEAPGTVFGILIAALKRRRAAGHAPFTVMSCDNIPGNGQAARAAVEGLARATDRGLADWIAENVAFPNGMVDCITPATSAHEREMVKAQFGIDDLAPVTCEPFRQWVLEDNFPLGRPALERVGVKFVGDVKPYELMKLRILNGGHAAIAYPAALLGHTLVHEAMADPAIVSWLKWLESREIIPTLAPIPGIDYAAYLANIISRFSNPEIADTVSRLCLDGSNRQPKFILPTIATALGEGRPISGLALEVAFWCRYCMGEDEQGHPIAANDELADDLKRAALAAKTDPPRFLANAQIFGTLGQNPDFVRAFSQQLQAILTRGVRATLGTVT